MSILAGLYGFEPTDVFLGCQFSGDVMAGQNRMGQVGNALQVLHDTNPLNLQIYDTTVTFDDGSVVSAHRKFNQYWAEVYVPIIEEKEKKEKPEADFILFFKNEKNKVMCAGLDIGKKTISVKYIVPGESLGFYGVSGPVPYFSMEIKKDLYVVAIPFKKDKTLSYTGYPNKYTENFHSYDKNHDGIEKAKDLHYLFYNKKTKKYYDIGTGGLPFTDVFFNYSEDRFYFLKNESTYISSTGYVVTSYSKTKFNISDIPYIDYALPGGGGGIPCFIDKDGLVYNINYNVTSNHWPALNINGYDSEYASLVNEKNFFVLEDVYGGNFNIRNTMSDNKSVILFGDNIQSKEFYANPVGHIFFPKRGFSYTNSKYEMRLAKQATISRIGYDGKSSLIYDAKSKDGINIGYDSCCVTIDKNYIKLSIAGAGVDWSDERNSTFECWVDSYLGTKTTKFKIENDIDDIVTKSYEDLCYRYYDVRYDDCSYNAEAYSGYLTLEEALERSPCCKFIGGLWVAFTLSRKSTVVTDKETGVLHSVTSIPMFFDKDMCDSNIKKENLFTIDFISREVRTVQYTYLKTCNGEYSTITDVDDCCGLSYVSNISANIVIKSLCEFSASDYDDTKSARIFVNDIDVTSVMLKISKGGKILGITNSFICAKTPNE